MSNKNILNRNEVTVPSGYSNRNPLEVLEEQERNRPYNRPVPSYSSPSPVYTPKFIDVHAKDLACYKQTWDSKAAELTVEKMEGKGNKGKMKKALRLQSSGEISKTFKTLRKTSGYTRPELLPELVSISIFEALVEREALRQMRSGSNSILQKFIHVRLPDPDCFQPNFRHLLQTRVFAESFQWRVTNHDNWNCGFISLVKHVLNCSRRDALASLAAIVSMSYMNTYTVSGTEHVTETNASLLKDDCVPQYLEITIDGRAERAVLVKCVETKGNSKQTISAIAIYSSKDRQFALPVSTAYQSLTIGKSKVPAHFYNQLQVDDRPSAVIFLCQNIGDAVILEKVFENFEEVVVVGHYGHDLSPFPWNFFAGRKVVLICSLDVERYLQVEEYYIHLVRAKAAVFLIFPYPILDGRTPEDLDELKDALSPLGQELMAKAIFADDTDSANTVKSKITDGALSYNDFKAWGQSVGLFVADGVSTPSAASRTTVYSPPVGFTVYPKTYLKVTWDHIFPRTGVTIICAKKDVGKTRMLFGYERALILNKPFMGINHLEAHVSLIHYDSESMKLDHDANLEQFELTDMRKTSIYRILKNHPEENEEFEEFELGNAESMAKLQEYALKKSAQRIIIDNVTSAVGDEDNIYTPGFVKSVYGWGKSLNTKGIGLIVLHHLHETHKNSLDVAIRGSDEWLVRAHTVISLIGSEEVLSNTKKYPDIIVEKSRKPGATIGIYFKACKMAGLLKKTILWAHLPYGASDWELFAHTDMEFNELEDSLALTVDAIPAEVMPVDAIPVDVMPAVIEQAPIIAESVAEPVNVPADADVPAAHVSLRYEEKNVLALITEKNVIKTSDAEHALGCGETKARGVIKSLMAKELVREEGEGRATRYLLK